MISLFTRENKSRQPEMPHGKVFIVMYSKDRPVLLARALASVLAQTCAHWHLFLINDGGNPEAVERLVKMYGAALQDRLTVKHYPHRIGREAAINHALARSQGNYVAIHDDGDSWNPAFLEETVSFLENPKNTRFAAVASRYEMIRERISNDRIIEERPVPAPHWHARIALADMLENNAIVPICLLSRQHIATQTGAYHENAGLLADGDYHLRVLLAGDIGTIPRTLAYRHQRQKMETEDIDGNIFYPGDDALLDNQLRYRNNQLRRQLEKHPEFVGVMQALLQRIARQEQRLNALEERIQQMQDTSSHIHESIRQNHHSLAQIQHELAQMNRQYRQLDDQQHEKLDRIQHTLNHAPLNDLQLANELHLHLRQMHKLLKPFRWGWLLLRPFWRFAKKLAGK